MILAKNKSYTMKNLIVLFLVITNIPVFAQQDPKAEKILDKVSEKKESYKTIKAGFSIDYVNLQADSKQTIKGELFIKGEKYKLTLPKSTVFYNGKTMWNFKQQVQEVYISEPVNDANNQDIFNHPNKIFNLYKKDFKYRLLDNKQIENEKVHLIDLYPKDLDKDYSRITLRVGQDYNIHSAKVYAKDGSRFTIMIEEMKTNKTIPDSTFTFNKKTHPKAEVIDMRF